MKREKERLEHLRRLPWHEYMQTTEWQATEKAAIKRAGNRCQVCNEEHDLSAHHRNYDNVGCEQEQDLIVLCLSCGDALAGKMGRAQAEVLDEEVVSQPVTLRERLSVFAPAALAGLAVPALLRAPLPAELFGLGAAVVLAVKRPQLYRELRDNLPEPARRIIDSWIGRMQAGEEEQGEDGEEEGEEEVEVSSLTGRASPVDHDAQTERLVVPTGRAQTGIQLAENLSLEPDEIIGKAIFITGIRRSGKTTLGARLAEEFGKRLIPLFIPDFEGDYLSLADVLPRAVIVGHSGVALKYADYDFVALEPVPIEKGYSLKAAGQFGYRLLAQGYQVVLDLSSYPRLEEGIMVQIGIIQGMFAYVKDHPDLSERVLAHVFLDEAQRYLPQNLSDSVIQDKAVLAALLKVSMDITAIGGKRGISPVILTQRIAQCNKKIMAQTEVFFFLRQTMDNDLSRCMEFVNEAVATKEQIAKFAQGQGVYVGADGTQLVTRFLKRRSDGSRSSTPKAAAAQRFATMPRLGEQEREVSARQRHPRAELSQVLTDALSVYEPGMTYRELGTRLIQSDERAREIWQELKRRGLLRAPSEVVPPNEQPETRAPVRVLSLLKSVETSDGSQTEDSRLSAVDPADLAKAFALWQAGGSSVRKLDAAAKAARYGWSNGKCRVLIEAMKEHNLIPRESEEMV